MLTIRLSRVGKKKAPQYRIVLMEKHRDPWSPAKEVLGHYNPRAKEDGIKLEKERIEYWISVGAQPSETVHNMLVNSGIIKADKKKSVTITGKRAKKTIEKNAEAEEKKKAAAEKAKAEAEAAKEKEAEEAEAKKAAAEAEKEKAAQEAEAAKAEAETPAVEEAKAEEPAADAEATPEATPEAAEETKAEETKEEKTETPAEDANWPLPLIPIHS